MVKVEAVATRGVMLVAGARIERERLRETGELVRRDHAAPRFGEHDGERAGLPCFGEGIDGARDAVSVGDIGFDVEDRRAVDHIRAGDKQNGTGFGAVLDTEQAHDGQPHVVGAEGRARGKDADARFAAELRREDGGRIVLRRDMVELPDEPEMAPRLNAAEIVGISELRFKDDRGDQLVYQTGLARDAEFCREIGMNMGDRLQSNDSLFCLPLSYHKTSKFVLQFQNCAL